MGVEIKKDDFKRFLYRLIQKYEFIAPVKEDVVRFKHITDMKQIYLKEQPYFHAKQFFLPKEEVMFTYSEGKLAGPSEKKERIIYGLRLCDLNAIKHFDEIFADEEGYTQRRNNTILIGVHCTGCHDYSFCSSMDLKPYYDLYILELHDTYYIDCKSDKGKKLISRYKEIHMEIPKINSPRHLKNKNIMNHFDDPIWEKTADERCLSCGRCNLLCPVSMEFIHEEKIAYDLHSSNQIRKWDSDQYVDFSDFPKERTERLKQRIFFQLEYSKKNFGHTLCVGCGRCITGCPTHIDFVEILNNLEKKPGKRSLKKEGLS